MIDSLSNKFIIKNKGQMGEFRVKIMERKLTWEWG